MTPIKAFSWALLASLTVNVFLAAIVATQWRHPFPPPPRADRIIQDMIDVLPPQDAEILSKTLQKHRSALDALDVSPRRDHADIRRAMTAEPFDIAAFQKIMLDLRARQEQEGRFIELVMNEALPHLSAEGRRRLADLEPKPRDAPPR